MPSRPAARHALVCDGGSTTTMPRDPIRLSADGPRPRPMQGFRSAAGWRRSSKPGQAYPSRQTVRETGSTSRILPNECIDGEDSRVCDSALLFLIYPLEVVGPEHERQIIANVE